MISANIAQTLAAAQPENVTGTNFVPNVVPNVVPADNGFIFCPMCDDWHTNDTWCQFPVCQDGDV